MSRAVIYEQYGGPEVLQLRDIPEPHAGPGEIRIRAAAVGLNPMDPAFAAMPELAARFNITLPSGSGYDFAGSVDEVGDNADGFTVGDRVYDGVMERAAADFVVMKTPAGADGALFHTPEDLSDEIASTLGVAGATASAAVAALDLGPADTVLAQRAASASSSRRAAGSACRRDRDRDRVGEHLRFLRGLGAEPVTYGAGLEDRVRVSAPGGITAAIDLFGTETIETVLALGVAPDRIVAIAAGPNPPGGAGVGSGAEPDAVPQIADAIVTHEVTVPIAARFPIEQIREAAAPQANRQAHGKIVVTL
jgi:NADPH:quinone reductase-like Zn-dependent oxidoreductase